MGKLLDEGVAYVLFHCALAVIFVAELRPKHLTAAGKNPNLANLSMSAMNNNNNGDGVSLSLAQIVV